MHRAMRASILSTLIGSLLLCGAPALAQSDIVFAPGTGSGLESEGSDAIAPKPVFVRKLPLACGQFNDARDALFRAYPSKIVPLASTEIADGIAPVESGSKLLDRTLLEVALASYNRHICRKSGDQGFGPSQIVVVDFAKPSSEPRLYVVDLITGQGLDTPVPVAHGVGSDRNDDGIADSFSNVYMSLASSLGAARGAEQYHGANGLSLRLDGLDHTNSQMRIRDIVAHSYQPERRRYFNASLLSARGGKPGTSEGCFVVAPHLRDWLFDALRDGGFLFAGLGGARAGEMPGPPPPVQTFAGEVQFVSGTGVTP
jgi:L,D-transpeptidase catalytic domain